MSHLTKYQVKNFKKFDTLELNNLKQFNLITGDNNVGKTCLLESLCFSDDPKLLIKNFHKSLCHRDIHFHISISGSGPGNINAEIPEENYFDFLRRDSQTPIEIKYIQNDEENIILITTKEFHKLEPNEKEFIRTQRVYYFNHESANKWVVTIFNNLLVDVQPLYHDDIKQIHRHYIPLIRIDHFYHDDLNEFVQPFLKNVESKQSLIEDLEILVPGILDVALQTIGSRELLAIATKGNKNFHSITEYGSGMIRLIRILLEIKNCENSRIMVDEIEVGIHFSFLPKFMTMIFKYCTDYNVQLFATTHSGECLEAFFSDKNYQNRMNLITLEEEGRVYTKSLNAELVNEASDSFINLRGGLKYGK